MNRLKRWWRGLPVAGRRAIVTALILNEVRGCLTVAWVLAAMHRAGLLHTLFHIG